MNINTGEYALIVGAIFESAWQVIDTGDDKNENLSPQGVHKKRVRSHVGGGVQHEKLLPTCAFVENSSIGI